MRPSGSKAAPLSSYERCQDLRESLTASLDVVHARALWLVEGLVRAGVPYDKAVMVLSAVYDMMRLSMVDHFSKITELVKE